MTGLEEVLKRAATDLDAVGAKWAIIGGLAVATRAAPRSVLRRTWTLRYLFTMMPRRRTSSIACLWLRRRDDAGVGLCPSSGDDSLDQAGPWQVPGFCGPLVR